MKDTRRTPRQLFQELRMSGPERRAAKSERETEARMRAERDDPRVAERLAARRKAESRRWENIAPW